MSSLISERATCCINACVLEKMDVLLRVIGVQGAKPMSVGRFDSTSVQLSARIAVATPLVVVWSCKGVL